MAQTAALPVLSGETGLTRYLEEIRRFPMLEPQQEYMLAKSWREHGDRDAAHKLVTSHLRLVAKIAMGYRGYGLPISEVISEGNVGLMQAVKRFEPEKGFRLATYAMWWIKAAIQEYILRSWSLVKMGTTANQKKLFFNLRKAKSRISALDEGDMRPDQVKLIAKRLGVTEQDVIDMNRRLGGDASLNAPIREDGDSGEWMDWLVDDSVSQESRLAESEQSENRHKALGAALTVLNDRERRIFEARRLADEPITLEELAEEFGVSRERVRQIEVRAFEKVQKAVKSQITAMENPRRRQPRRSLPRTKSRASFQRQLRLSPHAGRGFLFPQYSAQRPSRHEDGRARERGDRRDHQKKLRLLHPAPETAEPSGEEIADETRRQPHAHHHRQRTRGSELGHQRQPDRRQIKLADRDDDEIGKQPKPTRHARAGMPRRRRHDQVGDRDEETAERHF